MALTISDSIPLQRRKATFPFFDGSRQSPGRLAGSLALACALLGCGAPAKEQAVYLLVPHPDDEFEAWSAVEDQPRTQQLFIYLTRGEAGCRLGFPYYQPGLGEDAPGGAPGFEKRSCGENRVGSTLSFLRAMAAEDPSLGPMPDTHHALTGVSLGTAVAGAGCVASSPRFEAWTGAGFAVVLFDLGDGNLTRCEVEWALGQVRALRGTVLPDLPEQGVVAAGFLNEGFAGCFPYAHPDHRAVQQAVRLTDFAAGPQTGRTCSADPDTSAVRKVRHYGAMAVDKDRRTGAVQRTYGWLFGAPLPAGDEGATLFSEDQAFWRSFGQPQL